MLILVSKAFFYTLWTRNASMVVQTDTASIFLNPTRNRVPLITRLIFADRNEVRGSTQLVFLFKLKISLSIWKNECLVIWELSKGKNLLSYSPQRKKIKIVHMNSSFNADLCCHPIVGFGCHEFRWIGYVISSSSKNREFKVIANTI